MWSSKAVARSIAKMRLQSGRVRRHEAAENVSKVKNYCYDEKNFKVPIMKAVERVLGK